MRHLIIILAVLYGLGVAGPSVLAQERATTTIIHDTTSRTDTNTVAEARTEEGSAAAIPDRRHGSFSQLLRRYVDADGNVAYAELKAEGDSLLDAYLQTLASANVSSLNRDARLALWINAYNAYTLKLIVDHYPVENIWAVTSGPAEPKDNSPFALDLGPVADTVRTLDEIEHEIIRERFDEPRIHFALVCAAASCPPLRREAFTGPKLDAQLEDQAHTFFHNEANNRIPGADGQIELSRILKWYGEDFGASTDDLQQFIAQYFDGAVGERLAEAEYEVTFLPYDWTLNDQASPAGR